MTIKHCMLIFIVVLCLSTISACSGDSGTTGNDGEEQQDQEESDNPEDNAGGSEGAEAQGTDAEIKIDSDVVGTVSLVTLKTISAVEEMNSSVDTVIASFATTVDGEETTETVKAFFNFTTESSCTVVALDEIQDAPVVEDSTKLSAGLLSVTGDDTFAIAPNLDGLVSTYYGNSLENPDVTLRTGSDYTIIFSGADNVDAAIVVPEFTIEAMSLQGDDDLLVGKTPVESFIQSSEPIEINNLKNLNWQAMEGMATGSPSATQYGKQLLTIFTIEENEEEDETDATAIYCYLDPNEGDLKNALANSSSSTLIEDTLNGVANGEVVFLQISFHQVHSKLDEVNLGSPEDGTALVYTTAGGAATYIVTAE